MALGVALLALLALSAPLPAASQSSKIKAAPVAEKVSSGEWDGTWYYVNRNYRLAMWIRTVGGKPECKVRLMSLFAPEGFETDWKGFAEYSTRHRPGRFHFEIKEAGGDEISGDWLWDLQFPDSGRREEARFLMHRTGIGRSFSLQFLDLSRTMRRGEVERTYNAPRAWTFLKASNRQVLWDELPF